MNVLYLDATAGIAGDMTVAALLDLGLPLTHLQTELGKLSLPITSYTLAVKTVQRQGMQGQQFLVQLPHAETCHGHHHHRHYADIRQMIEVSELSAAVKQRAQQIFLRLAEAEAEAHQVAVDAVQFHEVGAVDSIVDIVATAIGLDWLGIEQVYCSAVPLGGGFVETAHGRLPVPAPATALLMKGLLVHGGCDTGERVTPTGAAILAALARPVAAMPPMTIERLGCGAGSRDFDDLPNILRVFVGTVSELHSETKIQELCCNLDDVTPEVVGYSMERLLEAGALDVWTTPIQMKKGRPGVLLSLLCHSDQTDSLSRIIMQETSTLGVRVQPVLRHVQQRSIVEQRTPWGVVRFKVSPHGSKPEYEDCCRIAREEGIPLREAQQRVLKVFAHDR